MPPSSPDNDPLNLHVSTPWPTLIVDHPTSAVRGTAIQSPNSQTLSPPPDTILSTAAMADPFEVRMRFTNLLQHLSASTTSSLKCAHYALKHRDQDEDLHSCIIEQLERNNMNNRANIMYFLEHLSDLAGRPTKEGHHMYVKMIERDIERIVDAVAPKDGSGAANVKVVRAVLTGLKGRGVLGEEKTGGLEEGLKGRDTRPEHMLGEDVMGDDVLEGEGVVEDGGQLTQEGGGDAEMTGLTQPQSTGGGTTQQNGSKLNGIIKVDKRVIEQRIEEDRERNKRLRESVWAVPATDKEELEKLWEETSDLGIDDYVMYGEEAAERAQASHYAGL